MANRTVYPYGTGGSLPSGYPIVNDFVTGGADKALSAEAGKEFYQEVFGEPEEIDLSEYPVLNGIIGADDKWAVGSGGTCILIPVVAGEKFIIKANDDLPANYDFLAQSSMGSDTSTPQWATGYSGRVILQPGESEEIVAPDDALTLYIRKTNSSGGNMLPSLSSGVGGLKKQIDDLKGQQFNKVVITKEYFNLQESVGTTNLIRATVYMPCKNGCELIITSKAQSSYQHTTSAVSVSGHSPQPTELYAYTADSQTVEIEGGYDYFFVMFKKSGDAVVSVDDILAAYDISIIYDEELAALVLNDGERRWDFFGGLKQGSRLVESDYLAIPKQFMTVRFDMPEWVRVRFQYGLRDASGWTGYYYSGDTCTFERGQSALKTEISFIDGRGINPGVYDRKAIGNQMSITILDVYDGDVFERNRDAEKYLGTVRATPNVNEDLPVIVHTSDIHADARRFNSVFDYADYLVANILVNTGDNPFYVLNDGIEFHEKIVLSHKTDFANCIGNHDTYASGLADVFNKNIAPFATDYGYHKSSGSDVTDKCYYYKDLPGLNLRIIAVDVYDGLTYAAYKARVSSTQMNWFIATLASTPSGYGVIVIMHQAPHPVSTIVGKTDFNDATMDPQNLSLDSDYMTEGKITGNPFGKIIDAFIEKGTVSGSYSQKTTGGSNETINYSADFTGLAEGVEFIAYLNGHCHRDFIGYVSDCEHNQLNLNVCSTSPISHSSGYKTPADIYRDSVGANQDAFNVYAINRTDKTVGVARIGSNLSKDLRPRKVMFVSYADE